MLEFDEANHRYYLDGFALPGVSEVISVSQTDDFKNVPADILQYKADLGTNIHEMLEYFDDGILNEKSIDATLQPFFDAYKRFIDSWKPTVVAVEKMFIGNNPDYPDEVYAGRIDRVFTIGDDKWIVDIKSGNKYKSHKLQTAGYMQAYNSEQKDVEEMASYRACLYLNKEGEFEFKQYNDDVDTHRFYSCLGVFYYKNQRYRKTKYNKEDWK